MSYSYAASLTLRTSPQSLMYSHQWRLGSLFQLVGSRDTIRVGDGDGDSAVGAPVEKVAGEVGEHLEDGDSLHGAFRRVDNAGAKR